jgi:glutamate racemase
MLKPAATLTKTNNIAVLATTGTLKSKRYLDLKTKWASKLNVIEPDCSTWAELIESGRISEIDIKATVQPLIKTGVDVIVLGCTHYHWIKQQIIDSADSNVVILEPSDSIAKRIKTLLR